MNGCPYCNGEKYLINTRVLPSLKSETMLPGISAIVEDGELCVDAVGDTYEPNFTEEFRVINFCPMCGRKLRKGEEE